MEDFVGLLVLEEGVVCGIGRKGEMDEGVDELVVTGGGVKGMMGVGFEGLEAKEGLRDLRRALGVRWPIRGPGFCSMPLMSRRDCKTKNQK